MKFEKRSILIVGLIALSIVVTLSFYREIEANQIIEASDIELQAFDRTPVDVTTANLQSYVGRYQLEPRFYITVTLEGQQLYAQGSNQTRVELIPASTTQFFNRHTEAIITFHPDDNDKVDSFRLQQAGRVRVGARVHPS
ncbi:MAG: DUF3471 domain-containing protein [Pseudomonadales bacterium]|nr:DUF3471 domain-containing protein [Pseudomonadales bacterium]